MQPEIFTQKIIEGRLKMNLCVKMLVKTIFGGIFVHVVTSVPEGPIMKEWKFLYTIDKVLFAFELTKF